MKTCVMCGKKQRELSEWVLRPSTPEQIAEAEQLRKQANALWEGPVAQKSFSAIEKQEQKLRDRASRLADRHQMLGFAWRYEGCEPDGETLLAMTQEKTGRLVPFVYGGGLFCRLRCAEQFAVLAHKAGYRVITPNKLEK